MLKRTGIALFAVSAIKGLFFFLDPLPQFYGGDSFSYLTTEVGVWIPRDRSFIYGLLIRNLEHYTIHSITPLIVLQVLCGIAGCMLLFYCAYKLFRLPYGVSLAITCLFALDPMQLLYERQIMAEAIGGFLFILAVTLSLSYLEKPRVWKCLVIPVVGIAAVAFRFNMYPLAWLLSFGLPLIVLLSRYFARKNHPKPEELPASRFWKHDHYRLAVHLVLGVACFLVVLNQYSHYYGRLAHRKAAVRYGQGYWMLSGLWSVAIPEDAPDARLAEILGHKHTFYPGANPVLERNSQLYASDGIIQRWERTAVELSESDRDDTARRTAMNTVRRAPFQVFQSAIFSYFEYFHQMKKLVLQIFEVYQPLSEQDCRYFNERFRSNITPDWKSRLTLSKWWFLKLRWWYFALLISPFLGVLASFILRESSRSLAMLFLMAVGVLAFLPGCMFIMTHLRLLHPLSFGTFLAIGVITTWIAQKRQL